MADPDRSELRASDVDRELTASQLRRHTTIGRLTLEELDQRLEWAYAAKTLGDLAKLTSDLPSLAEEQVAGTAVSERDRQRADRAARRHGSSVDRHSESILHRAASGGLVTTSLLMILIWGLTGAGYPWFLWVVGPAAVALIGQEIRRRTEPPDN
jgi:hypothetical protein